MWLIIPTTIGLFAFEMPLQSLHLARQGRPCIAACLGQRIDVELCGGGLPRPGWPGSLRFFLVFGLDGGQGIGDEWNEKEWLTLFGSCFETPSLATVEDWNEHIINKHVEALFPKSRNWRRLLYVFPRLTELVRGLHLADRILLVKGFQTDKNLEAGHCKMGNTQ